MAITDKYGIDVTETTWAKVDMAIAAFVQSWPVEWYQFRQQMKANQTEYQLAQQGDLVKSSFRNTLSFPVVARPRTAEEIEEDIGHSPIEFVESLKPTLERIIPGFTDPDEGGISGKDRKKNKLFYEFQKRYGHIFRPGEKF